jgi:hypothetical protein
VSVLVDDGFSQTGFTDVGRAVVNADNQPPVVSFGAPAPAPATAPATGQEIRPGEFLQYEGILVRLSAMDPEDNALTGDNLTLTTNIPELLGQTFHGERVLLVPPQSPGTGWTPGTYELNATAQDTDGHTATKTLTIRILADGDHDGFSAAFESGGCFSAGSDTDPSTPGSDSDSDGIPDGNELNTAGGPCNAETTYNAIIDFDPDNLQRTASGTPITVNVKVPFRSVNDIVPSSVKITKVTYVNSSGEVVEEQTSIPNVGWMVLKGEQGQAKFDRQAFIAFLNAPNRQIANQTIVVEVSGAFSDGTRWADTDVTNVK